MQIKYLHMQIKYLQLQIKISIEYVFDFTLKL